VTVDKGEWRTEGFEAHRAHLRAVAYRMLGSSSEADDAVQEAWLRLSRSDVDSVQNLGGWLTTVVGRICLDMLRARTARRETPLDERAPDLIDGRADGPDPEQEALIADSVGLALLVVLDTLSSAERLAFVLHDMFLVPSMRSPRSSHARQTRRRCSRAGPVIGSRQPTRRPARKTPPGTAPSCAHSSPPLAAVTSARCWPCCTQM
jgi:RNA polymerase sigma-70 factor, ECF subfamily